MIPVYAVMPSGGRECHRQAVASLLPQVNELLLIQTADFQPPPGVLAARWTGDFSISQWWNLGIGLAAASYIREPAYDVLIVNDDIIARPGMAATLSAQMRATTAVLACPWRGGGFPGPVKLLTRPGWDHDITGWCFMLRGETGLRCDEQFEWWYGDNDLDWTARLAGGSLRIAGCEPVHLYPDHQTQASPQLLARTLIDRKLFEAKWQITR
jgi:hypothetical protein